MPSKYALPKYTLRQLVYFVATAEAGTTSGAADRLFVSQSALSAGLDDLEAALDVQLMIRRKGKGVALTEAGRQVLVRARGVLQATDEIQMFAADEGAEIRGHLKVGAFEMITPAVLPRLIAEFREVWPEVTVEFVEGPQHEITEALYAGRIELAFQFETVGVEGLDYEVLSTPMPHVLLPEGHDLANEESVSLRQLQDEPFVLMSTDAGESFMLSAFEVAGVTPNIQYRSSTMDTIRSLVAHGLAYTIVVQRPSSSNRPRMRGIVSVPVNDPIPGDSILIVARQGVNLTARAREFWNFAIRNT
ncbi:MAG TPA: LysR family transcriptional regulator [Enteractinococcus sp.]